MNFKLGSGLTLFFLSIADNVKYYFVQNKTFTIASKPCSFYKQKQLQFVCFFKYLFPTKISSE